MAAKPLIPHLKERIKILEEHSKKLETSLEDQSSRIRNLEAKSEEAQNHLAIKEEFCHELVSGLKDGDQVVTMAAKPLIPHLKERIRVLEENSKTLEMILEDQLSKNRNLEAELKNKVLELSEVNSELQNKMLELSEVKSELQNKVLELGEVKSELQNKVLELSEVKKLNEHQHQLVTVLKNGDQEGQRNVAETARGNFNMSKKKALELMKSGNIGMLKFLVDLGLDVNAKCENDETLLHLGADIGNLHVVETLCRLGAEMNSRNEQGETPLHKAAYKGRLNVCDYLIKSGAELEACTISKWTPLHSAAVNGQVKTCEYLIRSGAQVNAYNNFGDTPCEFARGWGKLNVVRCFVRLGVET